MEPRSGGRQDGSVLISGQQRILRKLEMELHGYTA
jgi:hypothetical protein